MYVIDSYYNECVTCLTIVDILIIVIVQIARNIKLFTFSGFKQLATSTVNYLPSNTKYSL